MNILEVKKVAAKFKATIFKNSNSFSIGMLKSHFKGAGLQFKEHQVYSHGDDIRFLDWKMLAKMNSPYVKTFEEERNVEITVVIDASVTMFSGFNGVTKLQASIELCCLLYLLAKETGDVINTIVVCDEVLMVPKKNGEEGIGHLIAVLQRKKILDENGSFNYSFVPRKSRKKDDRAQVVTRYLSKRREIVIFSDFNQFFEMGILKKTFYQSNIHCFWLVSPLDEACKTPISVFSKTSPFSKKGEQRRLDFKGEAELKKWHLRRVKKLKIHERYLEAFVKEML